MIQTHSITGTKQPTASFKPDFISASVQDIDFNQLKSHGIRTCFIDLDNTVVERGTFEVSVGIIKALRGSGMDIYIATNRPRSRDLKGLKETLGAKGVIHPHGIKGKPAKRYFLNGVKDMGLNKHEVVMIGDRYLQDIFGANRVGIYSLLVHKLGKHIGIFDQIISGIEHRMTRHFSE